MCDTKNKNKIEMEVRGLKINKTASAKDEGISIKTFNRRIKIENGEIDKEIKIKTPRKKILEDFYETIDEKISKYQVTSKALYEFLKLEKGYTGSYETLKNYVREKKTKIKKEAFLRVMRNPGTQGQVDWKEEKLMISKNGEHFRFNIFAYILCYSQYKYYELTLDRKQSTLFKCLINAFKACGGVPNEIWFDNMKTVVQEHSSQNGVVIFEKDFLQFSKDLTFTPIACRPYRPQTKGLVEGAVKLTNRLDPYNEEFETLEDLIKIVNNFNINVNDEINTITEEKPIKRIEEEKKYLLPVANYEILSSYKTKETRKVTNESMISYEGNKYSVPIEYIGDIVEISVDDNNLQIYYNSKLIRIHQLSNKKFNYDKTDYTEIVKNSIETRGKTSEEIEEITEKRLLDYDKLYK